MLQVGLCTNLQNLPWFGDVDPNTFFPRCYRLCHQEEKHAFIGECYIRVFPACSSFLVLDDYRLTAAISLLKILINRLTSDSTFVTSRCSSPRSSTPVPPRSRHQSSRQSTPVPVRHRIVPEVAFSLAIQACEYFVGSEEHNDIDSETSLVSLYSNNSVMYLYSG